MRTGQSVHLWSARRQARTDQVDADEDDKSEFDQPRGWHEYPLFLGRDNDVGKGEEGGDDESGKNGHFFLLQEW